MASAAFTETQLQLFLAVAEQAAREAGRLVRKVIHTSREHSTVTDKSVQSIDLVTDTDQACEKLIFSRLRAHFPDFVLLGEESASESGHYELTDKPTWIVDPIDGTTNFVHRAPEVSVSIGLAVNREAVLGVIYDPCRDECFTAYKAGGAFLDGARIHVSQGEDELGRAVVSTNIGYLRDEVAVAHITTSLRNLMEKGLRGMRMCGSACNAITAVACGRHSLFYESGPHAWDVCAGAIIVQEAGGFVCDLSGGPFSITSRKYLFACSEELAKKVLACIHHPIPFSDWK